MTVVSALSFFAVAQYKTPEPFTPPAPYYPQSLASGSAPMDSVPLPFKVGPLVPHTYEDLLADEFSTDLSTPSNIKTDVQYDILSGMFVVRMMLGDEVISTPYILTPQQYNDWQMRRSMADYYRQKNAELANGKQKEAFNILDMNFALGPLEKIFGPGGVQLKTQGSVQVSMGIKSNKTDNPALSLTSRRKTYFDFDQKIQATINASVGDR